MARNRDIYDFLMRPRGAQPKEKPVRQVNTFTDEIGPFPGKVKPTRPGLYVRISKRGNRVWSWYDGPCTDPVTGDYRSGWGWCMFSSNKATAVRHGRERIISKHQSLQWIGRKG